MSGWTLIVTTMLCRSFPIFKRIKHDSVAFKTIVLKWQTRKQTNITNEINKS